MSEKTRTKYIRANIPYTKEDFISGNGEGVFVLVDEKTKEAYYTDARDGVYLGILDNDCFSWNGLEAGETIPFEMRGEHRPVVLFDWLRCNCTVNNAWLNGGNHNE